MAYAFSRVVFQLIGIEVLIDGLVKSLSDSGCVLSILRLSLVAGGRYA
jgi:hypothetical protein